MKVRLWTILGSLLVGTCLIAGERITRRSPTAAEAAAVGKSADSPATTRIASTDEYQASAPRLSNLPWIGKANRSLENADSARENQSLMMMVTPRIIIQDEEEDKLGILPPP